MARRILFPKEQIQQRVEELAMEISRDYRGKVVVLVALLKGAVPFSVDLGRALQRIADTGDGVAEVLAEYIRVSSYEGRVQGELTIALDAIRPLNGMEVIIVEDTADSCHTLDRVYKHLSEHQPASLRICVLVEKPDNRRPDITVVLDYVGFREVDLPFLGGCGLDVDGAQRFVEDIFEVPTE